ncbi:hypothetical protein D9M68_926990 [compost metagenome]
MAELGSKGSERVHGPQAGSERKVCRLRALGRPLQPVTHGAANCRSQGHGGELILCCLNDQ